VGIGGMAMPKKQPTQPIEESYPTLVLQFRAEGNLPPDMEMSMAEIAMFIAQGIGMINEKERVGCDVSFGKTSIQQYDNLRHILENTKGE
jgi:hypothetical protein